MEFSWLLLSVKCATWRPSKFRKESNTFERRDEIKWECPEEHHGEEHCTRNSLSSKIKFNLRISSFQWTVCRWWDFCLGLVRIEKRNRFAISAQDCQMENYKCSLGKLSKKITLGGLLNFVFTFSWIHFDRWGPGSYQSDFFFLSFLEIRFALFKCSDHNVISICMLTLLAPNHWSKLL